eukprot:3326788-Amphidinium_carterae.1
MSQPSRTYVEPKHNAHPVEQTEWGFWKRSTVLLPHKSPRTPHQIEQTQRQIRGLGCALQEIWEAVPRVISLVWLLVVCLVHILGLTRDRHKDGESGHTILSCALCFLLMFLFEASSFSVV